MGDTFPQDFAAAMSKTDQSGLALAAARERIAALEAAVLRAVEQLDRGVASASCVAHELRAALGPDHN